MKFDGDIMQLCIVVRDLEQYMKRYNEILGIGPWKVVTINNDVVKDYHVDGKPVTEEFEFRVGMCWVGNIEWELIQPIKGPNCYWKFLEEKGEGFHHLKFKVKDEKLKQAVELFAGNGFDILQTGRICEDVHYYPDTQAAFGVMMELGNSMPIDLPFTQYPNL